MFAKARRDSRLAFLSIGYDDFSIGCAGAPGTTTKRGTQSGNAKKDFLHKLSLALVRKHDVLVLEKLSTREMLDKAPWKSLVKRLTDGLHSQLITYCSYKAVRHGTLLWMINPRNTSRECSECHSINYRLGMKPGKWHCPHCGSVHDRNHNAGINIKARGLTSLSATLMGLFVRPGEYLRCPAFQCGE